ncbi:MAG: MBL fold metallo-hydrolase [Oleispira sp.]
MFIKKIQWNKFIVMCVVVMGNLVLTGCSYFADKAVESALSKEASTSLLPSGINVFLCGTGTPYPDEARNPSCLAIIAGSEYLVFDAGEGSSRRLDTMGLPTKELDAVFISHWHSDHFSGLDYLMNSSWVFGRKQILEVYGPAGVTGVIAGIEQSYALDISYRSGLQKEALNKEFALALPKPVIITEGSAEKSVVYQKNDVTVSAFLVDHAPVKPALGYLVEYKGRKVVISGDTRISSNVEKYSKQADILIHEALNVAMNINAVKIARELGLSARADQIEAIIPYHASTLEIAKLAQRAKVKQLVLSHFIPGPPNWLAEYMFVDGMDDLYDGDIVVGADKMHIHLPPK